MTIRKMLPFEEPHWETDLLQVSIVSPSLIVGRRQRALKSRNCQIRKYFVNESEMLDMVLTVSGRLIESIPRDVTDNGKARELVHDTTNRNFRRTWPRAMVNIFLWSVDRSQPRWFSINSPQTENEFHSYEYMYTLSYGVAGRKKKRFKFFFDGDRNFRWKVLRPVVIKRQVSETTLKGGRSWEGTLNSQ